MQLSNRDELCLQICKCFQDLNNTDWQNDIVTSGTWLQGSSFPLPDLDLLHCSLSLSLKPIALSPTTPCPAETWFLQPFPMGHVCGLRDLGLLSAGWLSYEDAPCNSLFTSADLELAG